MHRYKMVPPILLVLSLINFLLAVPVVLREVAPSVGEPPADQALAANSPPSPQTGTSTIQDVAPASSPEINKLPSSGESYPSDHDGSMESENYHASDEGGPGPSKSYPPPSDGSAGGSDLASNEGGPGSSTNHPLSSRPEIVSPGPVPNPLPTWNSHDWSETSSEAEPEPKNNFMSKTKSFFDKLVYKFKFWPRGGVLSS